MPFLSVTGFFAVKNEDVIEPSSQKMNSLGAKSKCFE